MTFKDPKNKSTKLLKQLYNEYQLEQLIKDHRRVAVRATKESEHHTSKTLIDHFSTNNPKYILSSGVVKSVMVDHYMINAIRKVNAWRIRNQSAPWIKSQIKRLMEERDRVKKNSIKNPTLLKSYKSLRIKVTNTIRSSITHYQSLINENKNNPKNMWRTINKVLDKAPNPPTIMQVRDGSKTASDSKRITNILNGHFVNVGPRLARGIEVKPGDDPLCHLNNPTEETVFQFKHVNERKVLKYIQNLKQGKSAGPDKIPTAVLQDPAEFLCKPPTMIFNRPLENSTNYTN